MTEQEEKTKYDLVDIKLTNEEVEDKKLNLLDCELKKVESDLTLAEMMKQLELQIPNKFIQDDIKKTKDCIKNKVSTEGKPTSDADIDYLTIRLEFLEKTLKEDIPMMRLRLQINSLKMAKDRLDAPEKQIKKLQREIRERKSTVPRSRVNGRDIIGSDIPPSYTG